ncbi:hypothetical protein ACFUJ0_10570 [Streptomyces sp. NPDC057242]|uniref:hypothetical protein n=1 Tax=unclassified Streptomyces TaxID=2593676 RepID=UPI003630FA7B
MINHSRPEDLPLTVHELVRSQSGREQLDVPELNLARYIKDGTLSDTDTGENEREVERITAETLKDVYFQDSGRRADSLDEVRFRASSTSSSGEQTRTTSPCSSAGGPSPRAWRGHHRLPGRRRSGTTPADAETTLRALPAGAADRVENSVGDIPEESSQSASGSDTPRHEPG